MATARSTTHSELASYRAKRDFTKTREPSGEKAREVAGHAYLIQKHAASRLHYDFRLELGGVLKSWAVARGPSLNPDDKRLAVHVEDHPLDYGSFEGTIPQGQCGGGTVMLWDQGTWEPTGNADRDLARGNLTFILHGKRLKGRWHLVRLRSKHPGDAKRENWLLIKGKDEYADANGDAAAEKFQKSVVSGRGMEGIARASGKSWGKAGARKKSTAEAADAVKALKKRARGASAQRVKLPHVGKGDVPAGFVAPQLATLVSAPPRGEEWVHEIKFDGYRLLAVVADRHAELFTRPANDWSECFKPLCAAFTKLNVSNAVIDGEVVHLADDGAFSFHGLQNALSTKKTGSRALLRLRSSAPQWRSTCATSHRAQGFAPRDNGQGAGQASLQRAFCPTRRSAIAPRLLAQAGDRPISLVRCSNGSGGQCFFQRHVTDGMSSHVHGVKVSGHGEGKAYIYVNAEGLVSLVQMGTIELHAWNATVDDVKRPDRLIFDLNPAPDVAWEAVKSAARDVRANLKKFGLVSFLKTTGGKGLHIVVPFARGPSWSEAKQFARSFSNDMATDEPDRFTINSRKDVRKGRIFVDYLRNNETASAVAAYAVRARPGAPVSLPIEWKELSFLKSGAAFSIKYALKRRADPWKDIAKAASQRFPLGTKGRADAP